MNVGHAHLSMPDGRAPTYGTLRAVGGGDGADVRWVVNASPDVRSFARRVFPGCDSGGAGLVFTSGRRQVEDLLWLMQRYPLAMDSATLDALERARDGALSLATARVDRVERPVEVAARFRGELKPFQSIGAAFLLDNPKSILADDMGLGKTVQAIAAAVTLDRWPVVVVPNAVVRQWPRMIEAFVQGLDLVCSIRGTKPRRLPSAPFYVVGYHLLRHWADELLALDPRVVVFDECQELRRGESLKYSAATRLSDGAEYVWGLSGTPIYNYGDELWWVLNAIESHVLGSLGSFTREWCHGYGTKIVSDPTALGEYMKREGLILRRLKADVQAQLPPKRRVVHRLDHDEGLFASMIGNAVALSKGYGDIDDRLERGRVARMIENETRKATGVSKAPFVAEFVLSLLDAGERVAVYAHHHDVHDTILEHLALRDRKTAADDRYNAVAISGRQTPAEKDRAVSDFASGASKCAVVAIRTAAGIDGLQGAGTVVVFAELDWSPAIHAQCEDRLHRMGMNENLESLLAYYLVCDAGSDDAILTALGLKVGQFVGIMGDAAETNEDRQAAIEQAEKHIGSIIEKLRRRKTSRRGSKGGSVVGAST